MDAFLPVAPPWTEKAVHAVGFRCPTCGEAPGKAKQVWLNRRSPVFMENYKRKWQEFYDCECGCAWWGWSDERPSKNLTAQDRNGDDSTDNNRSPFTDM